MAPGDRLIAIDYGAGPEETYYVEFEKLPDGAILITDYGRMLEVEPEQTLLENQNGTRN